MRQRIAPALAAAMCISAAGACGDESIAGIASPPQAAVRFVVTAETAVAFNTSLDDARVRLLPALRDVAPELAVALDAAGTAFDARDPVALRSALAEVDRAVRRIPEGSLATVGPEIDAVQLWLTHARRASEITGDQPGCAAFAVSSEACG